MSSMSPASPKSPGSLRELLHRRVAGFLHGGALGGASFLKKAAKLLPKRIRAKARSMLDACPFLALSSVAGVREAS